LTLTDPRPDRPDRPDEAGDQVRIPRWHVERLRSALDRDPSRHRRRGVSVINAPDLRLPETVEAVYEAQKRKMALA
jgi:hypothetical protein